jgi:hypothetical protein
LRDHPHFLAAPGKTGEEIEQQHRCKEQRRKAAQHQYAAALSHRGLQRRQEADGEEGAANQPDGGKNRRKRVEAAGRAALLQRLQNLSDGFAIVVGGAAGTARLFDRIEHRTVRVRARVKWGFGVRRSGRRQGRRRNFVVDGVAVGIDVRVADVERFLNGGKRDFRGIFDLLGIVRHVQSKPSDFYAIRLILLVSPASWKPESCPARNASAPVAGGLSATSANILLAE